MFTGLVEEKGVLIARHAIGPAAVLKFRTTLGPLVVGESIAVDGVCLTVVRPAHGTGGAGGFEADVSSETLSRTTLGSAAIGSAVNLERSLTLSARLGGHLVSGHVDCICRLLARRPALSPGKGGGSRSSVALTFGIPAPLGRFIAEKGSVAVNGVSLTVNAVGDTSFDVMVIPHTAEVTSLGSLGVGDSANLEVDLLARYVARLMDRTADGRADDDDGDTNAVWMDRLKESGML